MDRRRIVGGSAAVILIAALGLVAVRALWPGSRALPPLRGAERALDEGDLGRAEALLQPLLRDDPRDGRARLLYARLLRLSGRPGDAEVYLARARELGVAEAEVRRESVLRSAGLDFPRVEGELRGLLRDRPGDLDVVRALADGVIQSRRAGEAVRLYTRFLEREPGREDVLKARARALVLARRFAEAEADLRTVLRRRPDDFEARLDLAGCLRAADRVPEAEAELRACQRLRGDHPRPPLGLAVCALDRGDLDRARALLDRALALDPSSKLALAYRGNLEMLRRRDDRAFADFRRILQLDPEDEQAHLKLAQLYRRAGDPARAGEHERIYGDLRRRHREKPE